MPKSKNVHLDHHIERQSIRYDPKINNGILNQSKGSKKVGQEDRSIRIRDIHDEWFNRLRKPDFQRETNAWSPQQCVRFLDSVIYGKIIPSIILWKNESTGSVFVLDGAHRLSVVRAWIKDDWGGGREEYYRRKNIKRIKESADEVKRLVREKIGKFAQYKDAFEHKERLNREGKAPMNEMSTKRFGFAKAYTDIFVSNRTLTAQWERGDYESAEESFLRINRQGVPLGDTESLLIEYRESSYARTIMCTASGGESGHYWPSVPEDSDLKFDLDSFTERCSDIHDHLFVPSFETPIDELKVPTMVAPEYFQKHKYLLEVIPLLTERKIAETAEDQEDILKKDSNSEKYDVIKNGEQLISSVENALLNISGNTSNPKSLSLVTLFYWYNHKGSYKRGLLYGFLHWLLDGGRENIFDRKIAFSVVRKAFEHVMFEYKAEISDYERSLGAGLKSTTTMGEFFDNVVRLLLNGKYKIGSESFEKEFLEIMDRSSRNKKKSSTKSRTASKSDKNEVNIRRLFKDSSRCHICGGIVDLRSEIQYDHVEKFSDIEETHPDNLAPTHPFCNNNRDKIEKGIENSEEIKIPNYYAETSSRSIGRQATLFDSDFPS